MTPLLEAFYMELKMFYLMVLLITLMIIQEEVAASRVWP
jgi:hypothetical protein